MMADAKKVVYDKDYCLAYSGELDNELRPITVSGSLYKPGIRLCGHSDCVRTEHIQFDHPVEPKPITTPHKKTKRPFDLIATMRLLDACSDLEFLKHG